MYSAVAVDHAHRDCRWFHYYCTSPISQNTHSVFVGFCNNWWRYPTRHHRYHSDCEGHQILSNIIIARLATPAQTRKVQAPTAKSSEYDLLTKSFNLQIVRKWWIRPRITDTHQRLPHWEGSGIMYQHLLIKLSKKAAQRLEILKYHDALVPCLDGSLFNVGKGFKKRSGNCEAPFSSR